MPNPPARARRAEASNKAGSRPIRRAPASPRLGVRRPVPSRSEPAAGAATRPRTGRGAVERFAVARLADMSHDIMSPPAPAVGRSHCRRHSGKSKTKTTRGSHVLETDGRGLRHPPPARRGSRQRTNTVQHVRARGPSDACATPYSMSGTAPHSHHMSMCPQGPSHCTRTHTDPSPMTLATQLSHTCPPPRQARPPSARAASEGCHHMKALRPRVPAATRG